MPLETCAGTDQEFDYASRTVVSAAPQAPVVATRRPRFLPLVRFFDECLKTRLGAQLGKVAAGAITLGYLIALPFGARAVAGDASDKVVVAALGWLTWLSGSLLALSAAGNAADDGATRALALARGFSHRAIDRAQLAAVGRRAVRVVGAPAVLLAVVALALARSLNVALSRLMLLVGVLGYVGLVAVMAVVLVRVARALGPRHPRRALLLLVLLPHVLRELFPRLPSAPALIGFVAGELASMGAHLR